MSRWLPRWYGTPSTTPPEPPVPTTAAPVPPSTIPGLTPTVDGVGDQLFPALGNPGIDVQHYDLAVAYDPVTDELSGSVGIDLLLTEDRSTITLDSAGPVVQSVTLDGSPARFLNDSPELRIELEQAGAIGDSLPKRPSPNKYCCEAPLTWS